MRPDPRFDALARRAVFVLGPARGGTTLLARLLAASPRLVLVSTGDVLEHRAVFDYADDSGLCAELLDDPALDARGIVARLERLLRAGEELRDVLPELPGARATPLGRALHAARRRREPLRARVALASLPDGARLVLKSPELCFVADRLAACLPEARFALTWRPLGAVVRSIFDKGFDGWYWARWRDWKRAGSTRLRLPRTLDPRWDDAWQRASDLQRSAIRALSYFEALDRARPTLGARALALPGADLCARFGACLAALRAFLPEVDPAALAGFASELDPARASRGLDPARLEQARALPEIDRAWRALAAYDAPVSGSSGCQLE
jgi:hypothetical protein